VFNTTFKNISVITFVAEIGVPRETNFLLTIKLNYLHDLKNMFQCLLHLITYIIEITPENMFCIVNCKEDYDHLKLACKPIFQKIKTLYEKASIEVEGKHFDLEAYHYKYQ
jgi:hypothetical protein